MLRSFSFIDFLVLAASEAVEYGLKSKREAPPSWSITKGAFATASLRILHCDSKGKQTNSPLLYKFTPLNGGQIAMNYSEFAFEFCSAICAIRIDFLIPK